MQADSSVSLELFSDVTSPNVQVRAFCMSVLLTANFVPLRTAFPTNTRNTLLHVRLAAAEQLVASLKKSQVPPPHPPPTPPPQRIHRSSTPPPPPPKFPRALWAPSKSAMVRRKQTVQRSHTPQLVCHALLLLTCGSQESFPPTSHTPSSASLGALPATGPHVT
jgi:hypothetical protein